MTASTIGSPSYEAIQLQIDYAIDTVINSLPDPKCLSAAQQRGIVRRYTAVLEGNFIYWMTGAYLGVRSEEARSIILENLREEVGDCHPGMLRRFALAADAIPTDSDALAVQQDLMNVRLFVGGLVGIPSLIMMAFFEGFIQKFMAFLAELAIAQGSRDLEYTNVHGVCDVGHTQELLRGLAAELALPSAPSACNLFAGVDLLRTLLQTVIHGPASKGVASE